MNFINTVKSLYNEAEIFDIAIEPRIVVTMFADDTTVYLTEDDNFSDLNDILQCWCNASGAKFNTSKTEVIPNSIDIAKDGKATRILGAWIGNGVEEQAVWSPILDKIEDSLKRWEKWHPTTAQGMPKEIEDILTKRTRSFAS